MPRYVDRMSSVDNHADTDPGFSRFFDLLLLHGHRPASYRGVSRVDHVEVITLTPILGE